MLIDQNCITGEKCTTCLSLQQKEMGLREEVMCVESPSVRTAACGVSLLMQSGPLWVDG